MDIEKLSTEILEKLKDDVSEELFSRRLADTNYHFPQSESIFFEVEQVHTLQIVPINNTYYIGVSNFTEEDLTLVFTIEQIQEISDYLATKPNWEKLN